MELKISKKISHKKIKSKKISSKRHTRIGDSIKKNFILSKNVQQVENTPWSYSIFFVILVLIFGVLIVDLTELQIVKGEEYLKQSEENQVTIKKQTAYRGAILDRNGNILAQNVSSQNLFISIAAFAPSDTLVDT